MLAVEATELVVSNLHEVCCLTLITVCLLQRTLYKVCFQGILCLVKAVKRKVVKRKLLLPAVVCF